MSFIPHIYIHIFYNHIVSVQITD